MISGDRGQVKALSERLLNQESSLLFRIPYFTMDENSDYTIFNRGSIVDTEDELSFTFNSPWNSPLSGGLLGAPLQVLRTGGTFKNKEYRSPSFY
jgi:hypothetical protein